MNQNQRSKKAEQLRLAAQIIETGCEWDVKCGDSPEWLGNESPFVAAYKGDAGVAVAHGYEIRIKEPAVPEGWRELRDDEKDGRWIEGVKYLDGKMWLQYGTSPNLRCWGELANRIIVPVAKPKKRVPLGPEDVVPGSVIRRKNESQQWHWRLISYVDGVKMTCADRGYPWEEIMDTYEIKRPTDTEWQPAWKEVES